MSPAPQMIARTMHPQELFYKGSVMRWSRGALGEALDRKTWFGKVGRYWKMMGQLSKNGQQFQYEVARDEFRNTWHQRPVFGVDNLQSAHRTTRDGKRPHPNLVLKLKDGYHLVSNLPANYFKGVRGFIRKLNEIWCFSFNALCRSVTVPRRGEKIGKKAIDMATRTYEASPIHKWVRHHQRLSQKGFTYYLKNGGEQMPIIANLKRFNPDEVMKAYNTLSDTDLEEIVSRFVLQARKDSPEGFFLKDGCVFMKNSLSLEKKGYFEKNFENKRLMIEFLKPIHYEELNSALQAAIRKRAMVILGDQAVKDIQTQVRQNLAPLQAESYTNYMVAEALATNARIIKQLFEQVRNGTVTLDQVLVDVNKAITPEQWRRTGMLVD